MNMQQVRAIAKEQGVKVGKLKKYELIREIQSQEGNPVCYATAAAENCEQLACSWRDDCAATAKKI